MKKLILFVTTLIIKVISFFFPGMYAGAEESKLELIKDFKSKYLNFSRNIIIYLPKSYATTLTKKYPVIYAQDGQNLFDSKTAFMNNEWKFDETLDELINEKIIDEVIVVGIYNTGTERLNEYTFSVDKRLKNEKSGNGENYAKFIVKELKPYIDKNYRTLKDKNNTAIMGSSLGAIASLYTTMIYKNVFGKVICMSPSFWWDNKIILTDLDKYNVLPSDFKLYIDGGHKEGNKANGQLISSTIEDMRSVYLKLIQKGFRICDNLLYYEDTEGEHNEYCWGKRLSSPLIYMFGKFDGSIDSIKLNLIPSLFAVGTAANVFAEVIHPYNIPETRIYGEFLLDNDELADIDNNNVITFKKEGKVNITFLLENKSVTKEIEILSSSSLMFQNIWSVVQLNHINKPKQSKFQYPEL